MSLSKLNDNLNIIRSLANRPTLEADALKAEFDKAGNIIKNYINEILTVEIEDIMENSESYILQKVFPVGSRYVTQQNVNPSTILGFGTWERSKGKVYVGLDENDSNFSEIGKTGGEKSHTLTIGEIPVHSHAQYVTANASSGGTGIRGDFASEGSGYSIYEQGVNTGDNGLGQAHNNLQPYEVVGYVWIRRS